MLRPTGLKRNWPKCKPLAWTSLFQRAIVLTMASFAASIHARTVTRSYEAVLKDNLFIPRKKINR